MKEIKTYDVVIIGGSFAGLSAAMTLGRSLRQVLVIDSGKPCNETTPHAHNLLTHDGTPPAQIFDLGKNQVKKYPTVFFEDDAVVEIYGANGDFKVITSSAKSYACRKLLFATGIKDKMPDITGFSPCWGVSILHCPYCHGYEVSNTQIGVLANGDNAYHMGVLINHWAKSLVLFTNGPSQLTMEQSEKLKSRNITIIEKEIASMKHTGGMLESLIFKDGTSQEISTIFTRLDFDQHCEIPETMGCETNVSGLLKTDELKRTSVAGVFVAGDNSNMGRSLSVAMAAGTMAGASINKEMIDEDF